MKSTRLIFWWFDQFCFITCHFHTNQQFYGYFRFNRGPWGVLLWFSSLIAFLISIVMYRTNWYWHKRYLWFIPSFLLHNTHYYCVPDVFILLWLYFLFPSSLIIYHHNHTWPFQYSYCCPSESRDNHSSYFG